MYNLQVNEIGFIAVISVVIYHWFALQSSLNIAENGPLG